MQDIVVCFILLSRHEELMLLEDTAKEGFDIFREQVRTQLAQHNGYLCQEEDGTFGVQKK